jgi:L,D-transpeptidase YcbB
MWQDRIPRFLSLTQSAAAFFGAAISANSVVAAPRKPAPAAAAQLPAVVPTPVAPIAPVSSPQHGPPAQAQFATVPLETIAAQLRSKTKGKLNEVYAARNFQPIWAQNGNIGPEAEALLVFLNSAQIDGLKPKIYKSRDILKAVTAARKADRRGRANAQAIVKAELLLSIALRRYAMDLRQLPRQDISGMIYADPRLQPKAPVEETALRLINFAPSFSNYINYMQWMSPQYLRMRNLLWQASLQPASADTLRRIRINLERARYLPGPMTQHIVVDAAGGRLWYYQAGKQYGTMRVVVGKAASPTPMLAGMLQYAILNPYWNIPVDLVQTSTAPKVLEGRTLKSMNMEALSDWTENARVLSPARIDWRAVAAGTKELRVRQLPGPFNSMGRVKFMFPNDLGIYLHDTPERELLTKENRYFSNGCIRLEDAAGLGQWLMARSIATRSRTPEQIVPLPSEVPVYITYLTATEGAGGPVLLSDVYQRDN